jgi:hypothetical protein
VYFSLKEEIKRRRGITNPEFVWRDWYSQGDFSVHLN